MLRWCTYITDLIFRDFIAYYWSFSLTKIWVNDACTAVGDCLSSNHLTCDTTTHKCKCGTGYKPDGGKCIQNGNNLIFFTI